jgi:hypothetical protein
VQDIAYHYPYLTGLPGATDYPVHCVTGQNAVSAVGHTAYAGRELCADEAKKQTWEKSYLTFEGGAWINAAKAGTPKRNSCLCCVLPCRKESGGFTQSGCLLLLDLFLFLVKDFLLHGCKVGGDCTEIGADHLVRYHRINLCGADMLVTEYL